MQVEDKAQLAAAHAETARLKAQLEGAGPRSWWEDEDARSGVQDKPRNPATMF